MAVTTTNLGVITAYGDAVAAGYTGTKAEWQALMASYATVGQQAVDAKNAAVDAKNAAVQAKDTAVAAKDTATSKATEATTAANTATTKASEAAASAQNIAQSASQIAQNTSDISELKEELEVTSSYDITWSQGGINNSGTAVSRTNRIRTDYITIENDSIFVEIPAGFKYAIHAYNASKTRIGYIPSGSDIMTDRKATYKVSDSYDNAVYFRMWVAYTDDSNILPAEGANVTVAPYESVIDTLKSHVLKSVRILGVGNSYTRDSIRWLCKILKESGYEDVVVGHGYLGASTLAEQYATLDSADSNHSAFEYWKYSNTKNANKTSGKTLDEIFVDEPWDIVVFQQQSDESGQYASYVSSSFDINDFITYIAGKVSNANLKFALMMPWSHADGYTSTKFAEYYNSDPEAMLDAIKSVIPQVADHMSQCDYVVNAGEAIDLGRQNSYLNALGDQMLRTDKNHLYYGIPSYMVGLVYALTLCDVNLNNVMWYPTATDEGQTGITTSGYLAYLAKQCAFTAVNGYALADDISELKEDTTQLKSDTTQLKSEFTATGTYVIGRQNLVDGVTWTENYEIISDGTISEHTNFHYSNLVPIDGGETYKTLIDMSRTDLATRLYGYDDNDAFVAMLFTTTSSNSTVGRNEFDVQVPFNVTKIRISTPIYNEVKFITPSTTIQQAVDAIQEDISVSGYFVPSTGFSEGSSYGGYVNASGEIVDAATGWVRSDYIPTAEGASIVASLKGYSNFPIVAYYDENKQYLSSVSIPANKQLVVNVNEVVPEGVAYAIFVSQTNHDGRGFTIGTPAKISEALDIVADDLYGFKGLKVLCLGDSLTAGRDGSGNILSHNYPYYMQQTMLKGCVVDNKGVVGTTSKTYWNNYINDVTLDNTIDIALMMWGTNGGLVSENALATDVEPYDDYNDYADTGVGDYCKIIEYVMEQTQNHAQIILITPPYNGDTSINGRVILAQPVVKQIAERYNLPVIDMFKCGIGKFNFSTYMPDDSVHFNETGYRWIGTYIGSCVNAITAKRNV